MGYWLASSVVRQSPSLPRTASPSLVEPAQKLTPVTPTLSLAEATRSPRPVIVVPVVGLTIDVVGAVVSFDGVGDGVGVGVAVGYDVCVRRAWHTSESRVRWPPA